MSALSPSLRRRAKARKAVKVAIFCVTLVLCVMLALLILARFAGGWGVPYFSMTTERGSHCVNTFTGFDCQALTLGDVDYFGDLDLPPDTTVVSSHYVQTHDYALDAVLEVPPASGNAALAALKDTFGSCVKDHTSPLTESHLTSVCILANDQVTTQTGVPDSRVFVVGTALRPDKTRVINLSVRSR